MAGALTPNLTISLNHKPLSPANFRFSRNYSAIRCAAGGDGESGKLKGALSNMVGESVEKLLNKEENRELLDRLNAASERVEKAKNELAEIERQELEAKVMKEYIQKMEARAAEIAECQREVEEAKAMVEEAELSLSMGADLMSPGEDAERLESVKAAAIAALIGSMASLPISLLHAKDLPQLLLPVSITFVSCALFGVTFRYAVRRDLDNFQLKTGTSAAFGFVKGLATLNGGSPLEANTESFVSHATNGALLVSQELVVFLFAAVGLDFCFKLRLLSPFPIRGSSGETNQE